jgi:putative toxin-antitoxin system antitoxin component (TIGR02293 family)
MEKIRRIKFKTNNLNEMISMIKKGLPAETVVTLSTSLDMSIKATAELTNIAESTLARRRREKGKLRAAESDRVVRIARLRDRTVEVLEEEQWANRWLKTPLKAPSAVISEHHSYLLNPNHKDFSKIKVNKPRPFNFDSRLIKP